MERTTSTIGAVQDRLTDQHEHLLDVLRDVYDVAPDCRPVRVRELVRYWAMHEAVEETVLNPHLAHPTDRAAEGQALNLALASLTELPVDGVHFEQLLATLSTAIRRHHQHEHDDLLESDLTPEDFGEAHRALDIVAEMTTQDGGPFADDDDFDHVLAIARTEVAQLAAQVR